MALRKRTPTKDLVQATRKKVAARKATKPPAKKRTPARRKTTPASTTTKTEAMAKVQDQYASQMVQKYGVSEAQRRVALQAGYAEVPPNIHTFLNDPYFFQSFLGTTPEGQSKWRPYWVEALHTIYPSPWSSPFLEVILTGCIGAGKSTAGLGGMAYDICHLLHLKSPQTFYGGLGDQTRMVFALFNTTKTRAQSVLYDQMIAGFRHSPYFMEQLDRAGTGLDDFIVQPPASHRRKKSTTEKLEKSAPIFPNRVDLIFGSRALDIIGDTVVGAILCELNFQTVVAEQAYKNYNETRRRIISRFTNLQSYPGRLWLDSSSSDDLAFLESHIEQVKNDALTEIFSPALWEVKEPTIPYSGETFTLFAGDSANDPFIVTSPEQLEGVDEASLVEVPVEHKTDFLRNIHASIKELAGRTIRSNIKLIPSVELLDASLTLHSPIKDLEVTTVDFFDNSQLIDRIDVDELIKDPTPRIIHIDLSEGRRDRASVGCSKITGMVNSRRTDPTTNLEVVTRDPIFVTDFVLYIAPKTGHDIPLSKIKNFLLDLRDRGLKIFQVSTDGYQSANLRQDLTLANMRCALQSVDKTREPYDLVKDCILEGRWHGPDHPILRQEFKDLIDKGKKIDHPLRAFDESGETYRGSKDGTDTVAGSLFQAMQHMEELMQQATISEVLKAQAGRASAATIGNDPRPKSSDQEIFDDIFQNRDRKFVGDSRGLPMVGRRTGNRPV